MWKLSLLALVTLPLQIAAQSYSGDATYYNGGGGDGACGTPVNDGDATVALNEPQFDSYMTTANPNENPVCGKAITITSGGTSVQATITDRCPGCPFGGIDLTPSLFEQFADLGVGRIQLEWSFNDGEPAGGSGSGTAASGTDVGTGGQASTVADSGATGGASAGAGATGQSSAVAPVQSTPATQQTQQQGDAAGATQVGATSQQQQGATQAAADTQAATAAQPSGGPGSGWGGGGRNGGGGGGRGGRGRRDVKRRL